jgi:hypothetical protein
MQDIGGKKDTELSKENLTLCWREFSVESLDTVSLLEIGCCFPRGFARNLEPNFILFPGRKPCQRAGRPSGRSPRH